MKVATDRLILYRRDRSRFDYQQKRANWTRRGACLHVLETRTKTLCGKPTNANWREPKEGEHGKVHKCIHCFRIASNLSASERGQKLLAGRPGRAIR